MGANFYFFYEMTSISTGGNNESDRDASFESVPIHFDEYHSHIVQCGVII